jgi:uncharacterized membrane protein YcaP (DUF421 family)
MSTWLQLDWQSMFVPSTPLLEIFLRGTLVYLGLFTLLRVILKREAGTLRITDLLVVVLLADAAQNALADDYHSITEGLLLVATIICWSYTLNWLGYRFPRIQRFVHPPPLPLIRAGRMIRHNMRREFITEDELLAQLREQGVNDVGQVQEAFMEGDGRISVISRERGGHKAPEQTPT